VILPICYVSVVVHCVVMWGMLILVMLDRECSACHILLIYFYKICAFKRFRSECDVRCAIQNVALRKTSANLARNLAVQARCVAAGKHRQK
jgi:hypothetical protein